MSSGFNPYHKWLGVPVEKCPPTFYDLLQISVEERDRDVIQMAVERQKSHLAQFRIGKQSKLVDQLIFELEEAELTLLSQEMREEYDQRVLPARKRRNRKRAGLGPGLNEQQASVGEGSGLLRRYSGIVSILGVSFLAMAASVYLIPWKQIGSETPRAGEAGTDRPAAQPPALGMADGESGPDRSEPALRPQLLVSPFSQQDAAARQQDWARFLDQKLLETNSLGMKLLVIPPGEFQMGNTEAEVNQILQAFEEININVTDTHRGRITSSEPQHDVVISQPFRMSQQEVTQSMFRTFIEETGYQTDAQKDGKGGYAYLNGELVQAPEYTWQTNYGVDQAAVAPVVNVSWNDATAFCDWLSKKESKQYRLPTEAEWEYACRAGTTSMFSFGDVLTDADSAVVKEYAWFSKNAKDVGENYPHPVMTKKPNSFGLFDMHGNVYEWCQDWYDASWYGTLAGQKTVDPTGPDGPQSVRVIRGGSWHRWTMDIRSGYRDRITPDNRNLNVGFRVVCDVE